MAPYMNKLIPLLLIAVALTACQQQPTALKNVPHTPNELLYNDILSTDFVSTDVTVLGVGVGMTEADVQAKLGTPDNATSRDFGASKNWEYSTALGLNRTGVVYHFEDGIVTRIIVDSALNKYLQGNSTVGKSKDEVYGIYGIPERQYDLPGSFRFFVYNKRGFESYLFKGNEYQYAFVYPMRKLPTMSYVDKNLTNYEILHPEIPALLTDTTTLCNQGPTFGQNTATKECKAFENSCLIPDHWVEVDHCGDQ
jgi:hypothetical protein